MDSKKILTDSQLSKISGGFAETAGYASGYNIICPKCGASDIRDFESSPVDTMGQQFYSCRRCGQAMLLDGGGFGTLLNRGGGTFAATKVN